jgi:hypothetical protein
MKTIYKTIFLFFLLALNFSINSKAQNEQAKFEKSLHNSFSTNVNTMLEINNQYGNITFNNWEKNEVSVDIIISVWTNTEEKAQEYLQALDVKISNDSSKINFTSLIDNEKLDKSFQKGKSSFQINYIVNHPVYQKVNINNKYGDISINELCGKTNINLYHGKLNVTNFAFDDSKPVSKIQVDYGKATIGKCSWGDFELNYSTLEIKKSTAIIVKSKYSNVNIDEIMVLIANGKYDNYNIKQCNRMTMSGNYNQINSDLINKELSLDITYGSCTIKQVAADFENIDITSKYTNISAPIADGSCYQINVKAEYGSVKISPKANIDKHINSTGTSISGFIGCKGNASIKVNIDSKYGDIKLY